MCVISNEYCLYVHLCLIQKCLMCPDFDTCDSCYRIVPEHHPKHTFIKLSENQDLVCSVHALDGKSTSDPFLDAA